MTDDPFLQDERLTLEAGLREALQHRRAAEEQAEETRAELSRLMRRARQILERRGDREPPDGEPGEGDPGPPDPSDG